MSPTNLLPSSPPFPLDVAVVAARRALRRRRSPRPARRAEAHAPLVLVVDDTEDNRDLYAQFLIYAGYRVEVAVDGYEALERVKALRPDVVIMDLALPGMDGWETTRRLKADEDTRDIPVIALTGHVVGDARARALAAGCGAFLAKPCSLDLLLLEVRRALEPTGS